MMSMTSSRRRLVVSVSVFVLASVPLLGREAASPDDRSNGSSSCGTRGLRERLHCYSEQFYGLFRRGSDLRRLPRSNGLRTAHAAREAIVT